MLMTSLKWDLLRPFKIRNYIGSQNSDVQTDFELYQSDNGDLAQGTRRFRFTEYYPKSGNSPWVENSQLHSFS